VVILHYRRDVLGCRKVSLGCWKVVLGCREVLPGCWRIVLLCWRVAVGCREVDLLGEVIIVKEHRCYERWLLNIKLTQKTKR
jgi:hypothetical protein